MKAAVGLTLMTTLLAATQAQKQDYRIWDANYGNLSCFSCSLDFRWKPFDINDSCLGILGPVDKVNLVRCGSYDLYCKEDFVVGNGILWTLTRQCTSMCYYGCRPRGFGINHNTCTSCCKRHGCNDNSPPELSLEYKTHSQKLKSSVRRVEPWMQKLLYIGYLYYCTKVIHYN